MRAYNLFRHRDKQHLLCAVPEDHEVPRFIAERAWSFGGKLTEAATAPVGFDVLAARDGVRLNGFYLFQSFSEFGASGRSRTGPCMQIEGASVQAAAHR
jgi:hypothetical protein